MDVFNVYALRPSTEQRIARYVVTIYVSTLLLTTRWVQRHMLVECMRYDKYRPATTSDQEVRVEPSSKRQNDRKGWRLMLLHHIT